VVFVSQSMVSQQGINWKGGEPITPWHTKRLILNGTFAFRSREAD